MFKAQLIQDAKYYRLRRGVLWLMIFACFTYGIGSNIFFDLSNAWLILFLVLAVVLYVFVFREQRRMISLTTARSIEIDDQEIRILDKNKQVVQTLILADLTSITVKEDYSMPEEGVKEYMKELGGRQLKNYIEIESTHGHQRFEFLFDSYYMIEQLKKSIETWKARGYDVKVVGNQ